MSRRLSPSPPWMFTRSFACFVALTASIVYAADPKPGPVNVDRWKSTPCVTGRLATESDIKAGRAVYVFQGNPAHVHPLAIPLPHCALWHDAERQEIVPVVCIQAEEKDGKKVIGFRLVSGGLGAGLLSELTLLDAPDARFRK